MNEFLRKFDTIRFVAPWSIFRNFLGIFHFFWIQIWILNLGRFGTGPNRNRSGPVWPVRWTLVLSHNSPHTLSTAYSTCFLQCTKMPLEYNTSGKWCIFAWGKKQHCSVANGYKAMLKKERVLIIRKVNDVWSSLFFKHNETTSNSWYF